MQGFVLPVHNFTPRTLDSLEIYLQTAELNCSYSCCLKSKLPLAKKGAAKCTAECALIVLLVWVFFYPLSTICIQNLLIGFLKASRIALARISVVWLVTVTISNPFYLLSGLQFICQKETWNVITYNIVRKLYR